MRQRGPGPAPTPAPADPARAASVRAIAEQLAGIRGPLLPILHEVVATHGHVDDDDVAVIADVLNLSRADVHGVVTFYHDLRRTPRPRTASRSAAARPARPAALRACMPWPTDRWAGSPDVEVGEVFCLGLCASGPSGTRRRHAARGASPPNDSTPSTEGWQAMTTAWVPCDAAAVALGADAVADALAASGVTVRRNGSRGMLWLEPLVEVETDAGRVGYGNVTERPTSRPLLDGALDDTDRCIGVVDEHDVAGPPAPRVVRPGRGHRADRPRRLPRARRAAPGCERPWRSRPRRSSPRSRRPGCAVAAARASRPASSGRRCARHPPT